MRARRACGRCASALLAAFGLYAILGVLGAVFFWKRIPGWFGLESGAREWWLAEALGGLAFVALWLLLFNFVFVLLAGVFSGLVWDRLSAAVEQTAVAGGASSGAPPAAAAQAPPLLGCGAQAGDSFARLLLNGTLGALAFVLGCALGPIPGIAVAAVVGLLDFTSPAYLRRGLTLGPQWARLRRDFDRNTLAFALIAGLLSLVPLIGVLLLPGLVAGGTLLVQRREEAAGESHLNLVCMLLPFAELY